MGADYVYMHIYLFDLKYLEELRNMACHEDDNHYEYNICENKRKYSCFDIINFERECGRDGCCGDESEDGFYTHTDVASQPELLKFSDNYTHWRDFCKNDSISLKYFDIERIKKDFNITHEVGICLSYGKY